jgi:hypothetical protein
MHLNSSKSRSLILSIALLASVFSVSGYAHNPAMHQNITTELVVIDNVETAYCVDNFNGKSALQTEYFSLFTSFDFNHFLDTYNKACDVKFEAQKKAIINAENYYLIYQLAPTLLTNTDDYHNIFIG